MNWTDKILRQVTPPVCGNHLRNEDSDNEDDEVEITCDICGEIVDPASCPTCPVCGVALCGDKECAEAHIAKHHPEWDSDGEDDDLGRCDDCDRDGDCHHCPGHPGAVVDQSDPENVPFTPVPVGTCTDREFLKSPFAQHFDRDISQAGWRLVIGPHGVFYPAVDGSYWDNENGQWTCCGHWRDKREDKDDKDDNDDVVACHQCGTKLLYERSLSCVFCEELFCSHICLDEHLVHCHKDSAIDFADGEAIDFVTAGTPEAATLIERINADSRFCPVQLPDEHRRIVAILRSSGDPVRFDKFGQAYRLCPGYGATWSKVLCGVGTLDPVVFPECAECGTACDRGVVSAINGTGAGMPFCSSECLDRYRSKR